MKIFKQETNKSCGIACLRSIMNFYGNSFSEKDVWEKHKPFLINKTKILNPIISLGLTSINFGFKVKYVGYNPLIANKNKSNCLKKSLREKLKNYDYYGKFIIKTSLEFLEKGGKIKIEKLTINKIKKLLDKYKFLLTEIKPAFINKNLSMKANHKIILIGYTKKGFKILDPGNGKPHIYSFDSFILALYTAIPELLIIKL